MKSCIVTGVYHKPGQTFVNRHISLFAGGETVVVTGRWTGENPYDRPVFHHRRRKLTPPAAVMKPIGRVINRYRHGADRVPFGQTRRELEAFLRDHGTQVILSEFGTEAPLIAPLANDMGLPVFTYFRGSDATKSVREDKILKGYRKAIPRLNGVFAVSQFLLDNLAKYGISHPRSMVIPSGVNVRTVRPAQKIPKKCLAVGRFVEKKAPDIVLRCFARVAAAHPDARLMMIGDGPMLAPCRALAAELGVTEQVHFTGALPHDQVLRELAETDIFLQHSVTGQDGNAEGLPTAIQEAMACGAAVLSTRHAGIPEAVVEGETGLLVDEFDEAGFTQGLQQLLDSPMEQRAQMGAQGRARAVEHFDNDKLLAKLEATIQSWM
jgi:glycosyltransferase involved in cell wall biosynthesis